MVGRSSRLSHALRRRVRTPAKVSVLPNENERRMARIDTLSRGARANWLGLMAYLAFAGVTLLGVEDADFFIASRETALPLIGVTIPTLIFFYVAPVLGAALYVYLHLHLMTIWHVLAEAPPTIDGKPLGDRVFPWLVNDLALSARPDRPLWNQPLRWLSNLVTLALVWGAGPFVLAEFWWRSAPAHDFWMTQIAGGCLWVSLLVGVTSGVTLWQTVKKQIEHPKPWRGWLRKTAIGVVLVAVLGVGAGRSKIEAVYNTACGVTNAAIDWVEAQGVTLFEPEVQNWIEYSAQDVQERTVVAWLAPLALVSADLAEVELVPKPADWRPRDEAKRLFRVTWCERKGLPLDVCGPHQPETDTERWVLTQRRAAWCEANLPALGQADPGAPTDPDAGPSSPTDTPRTCESVFRSWDTEFAEAWNAERRADLASLQRINLQFGDMRKANMRRSFLAGSNLLFSNLEGSNISFSVLESSSFGAANIIGANLYLSNLDGASLIGANLKNADLRRASFEGAMFKHAEFQRASISDSSPAFTPAHGANFSSATGLTQGQLATVIGDSNTRLPADAETGMPLHVWSCWPHSKSAVRAADRFAALNWQDKAKLRERFICPPGTDPQPVGTFVPAE